MNNTTLHFAPIPPEKLWKKVWKTLVGVILILVGLFVLNDETMARIFIGTGGFLLAGDILRATLPVGKDIINFVAWAIKKIKGAVKNGNGVSS